MAVILNLIRLMPACATVVALVWALSTNPLSAPFAERTGRDLAMALEREVARVATPDWIEESLADAVATENAERAEMLLTLATDLGRPIQAPEAEALIAAQTGWIAGAQACAACMADVAQCPSVALLGACAVPFEMSPLGDLNALRRAGTAWWDDSEVDEFEAGLAVLGLGATGAAVASGGSSLTVKAGAGLLRMARRMGSITPGMVKTLDVPVNWSKVPELLGGSARLEDVTDTAKLAVLGEVVDDLGKIRAATSTGDALRLMRLVDTPEDARRLVRIADAAGPGTARTLEVLGKGRAFRASVRLTRAAAGTFVLIWLAAAQLAVLLGTRMATMLLRHVVEAGTDTGSTRHEPVLRRM
ncbi:MAG: hypothetical protein AAGF30_04865 [Pseudomonadota bacterium]